MQPLTKEQKRLKYACYLSNISMAVVGNLPPLLFITFRSLYGISYSLLGLLVLINFSTQLVVDSLFSAFSKKLSVPKIVRTMPFLAIAGFIIYSASPILFGKNVYAGLVIGTVIFSAASGLAEVLVSPIVASIPSENPDREMSKLHSVYAWGVVAVIALSTVFLFGFGSDAWQWLPIIFTSLPILAAVLFFSTEVPELKSDDTSDSGTSKVIRNKRFWLCVFAIFLGGAAECTMAQWCSGYAEKALGIEKIWGDIFGAALFGLMLGLGRTLYAKRGKSIERVLLIGAISSTACYLTAALTSAPILGLLACATTGLCVSMLWPGCLIVVAKYFPAGGVFIYAMMAAGGDFGASISPQLTGIITDAVAESKLAASFSQSLGITAEQLGMKCGILTGMVFSLVAIFIYFAMLKIEKSTSDKSGGSGS